MSHSDIMKHIIVHPTVDAQAPGSTATFEVNNKPVVLRGFNIPCDAIGYVEMGHKTACGSWTFAPYSPECDQKTINACANVLALGAPGFFRVVFRHRVTDEVFEPLDDTLITATETTMPVEMLAKSGGTSMGCGSNVSITEANGCLTIVVDGEQFNICPGDKVSCAPGGVGIIINDSLCQFPEYEQLNANIVTLPDGRKLVTIGDQSAIVGATTVQMIGPNSFRATNPDGSQVNWVIPTIPAIPDVPEYTLAVSGNTYTLRKDGVTMGSWTIPVVPPAVSGDGTAVASINTAQRTVTITNADGSVVTFEYGASRADFNEGDNTVTIHNPDGSVVSFPVTQFETNVVDASVASGVLTITLADESTVVHRQTQARLLTVAGAPANDRRLHLDHNGTWPDVDVFLPYVTRPSSDIAVVNVYNHDAGEWEQVAVVTPEDVVILNNPVIYIRETTGTANPPITEQADLTVANAFDSFGAVRTFMNRTLTVGKVTLDVRGSFANGIGNIGPAQFKNAQTIEVRGDAANVTGFTLDVGHSNGGRGCTITGGDVTFRDFTNNFIDVATTPMTSTPFYVGEGSLQVAGSVRFAGSYNAARANAADSSLLAVIADGARAGFGVGCQVTVNMTSGSSLDNGAIALAGSQFTVGRDVAFNLVNSPDYSETFINLQAGSNMRSVITTGLAPTITGSGRGVAPHSILVSPLAIARIGGDYGNQAAVKGYDWGVDVSAGGAQAVMEIDAIGVLNNVAGP